MKLFISLTLFVCLFSNQLIAQPKPLPDSIRVELPAHQSLITFELRRYSTDKHVIRQLPEQLNALLKHLATSLTADARNKPQHIEVVYQQDEDAPGQYTVRISDASHDATQFTVQQQTIVELLPPGWTVHIRMKEASVMLYTPTYQTLTELTHLNFERVTAQLDADPENRRELRYGIIARLIMTDTDIRTVTMRHRIPNDMLGLHPGVGAGMLRDRFYPELNFTLSLYFSNRYRENVHRFSALFETKIFTGQSPEGDYRSWPASFVSFSYAFNAHRRNTRWTGIGVGFLTNNRSDLFTGKTLKLFFESDIGSPKLNIVPELYLTNDYKQSILGVKLNYKF